MSSDRLPPWHFGAGPFLGHSLDHDAINIQNCLHTWAEPVWEVFLRTTSLQLLQAVTGQSSKTVSSNNIAILLCGVGKMFVGELVEEGKSKPQIITCIIFRRLVAYIVNSLLACTADGRFCKAISLQVTVSHGGTVRLRRNGIFMRPKSEDLQTLECCGASRIF